MDESSFTRRNGKYAIILRGDRQIVMFYLLMNISTLIRLVHTSSYQQSLQHRVLGSCAAGWRDNGSSPCYATREQHEFCLLKRSYDESYQGTLSKDKHEILFGRFSINYNDIDERFKKGSILVRREVRFTLLRSLKAHTPPKDSFTPPYFQIKGGW